MGLTDPLPPPPNAPETPPVTFTTEQVAEMLHVSPGAVRVMHTRGTGPPSVKAGRRRLYPRDALTEWLETR